MVRFERFQGNFPTWNSTLEEICRGSFPRVSTASWEGPVSEELIRSFDGKASAGERGLLQAAEAEIQGVGDGRGRVA